MAREKKITLPPLVRAARLDEAAAFRDRALTEDAALHRAYRDMVLGTQEQGDAHNVPERQNGGRR